jgi:transposase-like protein
MNPEQACCPNPDCPARGQSGRGNISIHSRKEARYRCRECGKTFAATSGTPLYRVQKATDLFVTVITLLAHGCPVQAIVAAFGLDERTVSSWQQKAGTHCQRVLEQLVEQPRQLGEVQADELRVKIQGAVVWLASAICVQTRLWLGGAVSHERDRTLIRRLLERVKRCALPSAALLLVTDGLSAYVSQAARVFREKVLTGERGPPAL